MEPIDRRAFIVRSGAVVAATGAAMFVPTQLVGAATKITKASGVEKEMPTVTGFETPGEPIIAHVRNLASGEISIFSGDQAFTLHDRELAMRLGRAIGGK